MRRKVVFTLLLVFVLAAATGEAWELKLMVGLEFWPYYLPPTVIEVGFLTTPCPAGYQQEIGVRYSSFLIVMYSSVDLVARSWFSFPYSGSGFLQDRFRCAIEYSPQLFLSLLADNDGGTLLFPGFRTGLCASIRFNPLSADASTELFMCPSLILGEDSVILTKFHLTTGVSWRWLDL